MTYHTIRPADPARDFARLAAIYSSFETSPSTEAGLLKWYQERLAGKYPILAAVDEQDLAVGVASLNCDGDPADGILDLYVIVLAEHRGQGIGARLYAEMEKTARSLAARKLYAAARDDDPVGLGFAKQRGFRVRSHAVEMALDLDKLEDARYDTLIARLQSEGFRFTSMAELGDTPEARQKLYALNSSTTMTTPGADGRNPWASFEDFQSSVCQAAWYRPEGQKVAIDTHTETWAGMSAITRFDGADHAYNLFTGVDPAYRNRGLGTAVKVTALRYARAALGVHSVRTNHNAKNEPMIAIDRKLGYQFRPGMYGLEKALD